MAEYKAKKRLSFFTPDGNRRWKLIPVWDLNVAPKFVARMMNLKMEWYTLSKKRGLKNIVTKIIFDCVLLYGCTDK